MANSNPPPNSNAPRPPFLGAPPQAPPPEHPVLHPDGPDAWAVIYHQLRTTARTLHLLTGFHHQEVQMLQQRHTHEEIEMDARHFSEVGRLHQVQALQAEALRQQAAYLARLCTAHEREMGMASDSDDDPPPPGAPPGAQQTTQPQQTTQTAASSSQQTTQPAQTAASSSQQTEQPAHYSPPPPLDQLALHNPWPGPAPPPGSSSGAPQRGA